MTAKKSFLVTIRIFFIVFSVLFVRDAFYKWDGYSYYMTFTEFIPHLSLAFILWTIIGIIFAVVLWLLTYGLFKILSKFLKFILFEHIIAGLFFGWFILFIKAKSVHFSVHEMLGVSRSIVYAIAAVSMVCIVWFLYKNSEKILNGLNTRITPLVWLFALLFVLAIPLSFWKMNSPEAKTILWDNSYVNTSAKERPNIIMVVWDTLAARNMSLYGYSRPTTPFLSEWAKNAIVFNKAHASCNYTSPSTMSMLTGQRPWTHRYWSFLAFYAEGKRYEDNLPRVLRDNGYAVYGFVQNQAAHPYGLGINFAFSIADHYSTFWIVRDWGGMIVKLIKNNIVNNWIFDSGFIADILKKIRPSRYIINSPSEKVYNHFLDYISEINSNNAPRQPFFAYLHAYPPHAYYLPPEPYAGKFGDAERFRNDKEQDELVLDGEYGPERQKDVDILRKRYDEHILYSDSRFKSFMSRLSEIIDLSNTIIIFASDHGESFSHGYQGHCGPPLYESLVHIPLIIKIPGKNEGRAVDIPVAHPDIAPTILELAGIPVPDWMEGRSLLPIIEGNDIEPRPVFSMQLQRNSLFGNSPITKGTIAVWDGDYKLIDYLDEKNLCFLILKPIPTRHEIFMMSSLKSHSDLKD